MNIFSDIRKNIGSAIIRKQAEKNRRKKKVCNLDNASSLAVLFGPTKQEEFHEIKNLLKTLNSGGQKLYVIGYIDDKEIPEHLAHEKSINFITNDNLNWLYKPQTDFFKVFVTTNFDILINLDIHNSLPVQYLCTTSVAGFKVGGYTKDTDMLDLMINTNGNNSMKYLIDNIIYYLRILNQKN